MQCDALGFVFTVACDDAETSEHVEHLLAGLADPGRRDACETLRLAFNAYSPPAPAITALIGTMNLRAVAAAGGNLLLHAGAVARTDGGTAVLCGPSGSGKSTLTAALVGRGSVYVTDETVCLDPLTLRITPFRKPLSLKPGSQPLMPQFRPTAGSVADRCTDKNWHVAPSSMGGLPLPAAPLDPQVLVFPTYSVGAPLTVQRLPTSEAIYLMGGNTSRLRDVATGPLPALARIARRAPAYRLVCGDLETAADQVQALWAAA